MVCSTQLSVLDFIFIYVCSAPQQGYGSVCLERGRGSVSPERGRGSVSPERERGSVGSVSPERELGSVSPHHGHGSRHSPIVSVYTLLHFGYSAYW